MRHAESSSRRESHSAERGAESFLAAVLSSSDQLGLILEAFESLEDFDVEAVSDVAELLAMLERIVPDVLVLGHTAGPEVTDDALGEVRRRFRSEELPVLWLAGDPEPEEVERALAAGVSEMVRAPLVPGLLARRIENSVRARRLQLQLDRTLALHRREHDRATQLTYRDELTGLPTRQRFRERIAELIADRSASDMMAVFIINIDRFKAINDGLGLGAGDSVLRRFADRLRTVHSELPGSSKEEDLLARLGSDAFGILLPYPTRFGDVSTSARMLLAAIDRPYAVGEQEIFLTASIGAAIFPTDGADVETLVGHSETAMKASKNAGRDTFRFYSQTMDTAIGRRFELENRLRRALDRDELELHYQPIVNATTRMICGVEALLRWRPLPDEWVPPYEFIPLAEQTGLIVPIGEWVLTTACTHAKDWNTDARTPIRVAVNLSPRELRKPGFVSTVSRIIEQTRIDPRLLEMEITESGVVENDRETLTALHQLKVIGIRLAVDDFGTGHSVLNYLKKFPLDALKIDRSFTRGIMTDADDAAIVRATIGMAHGLKMRVIAEGVEQEEQLYFLSQHKCDEAQGYYFGKPMPQRKITEILARGGELPAGT